MSERRECGSALGGRLAGCLASGERAGAAASCVSGALCRESLEASSVSAVWWPRSVELRVKFVQTVLCVTVS